MRHSHDDKIKDSSGFSRS
uniref:Uncharacterized protein n=1 Tax=Arundo donax TaxID=35708 RepID=A0A0A8Z002_ARUDO